MIVYVARCRAFACDRRGSLEGNQLREGRVANFFASLQRLAKTHPSADPETSPHRLLQYFQKHGERLRYRWAREQNLPIGSGGVGSAARHIVQQRLKQSGMRWS